jgi:hypothetical protein
MPGLAGLLHAAQGCCQHRDAVNWHTVFCSTDRQGMMKLKKSTLVHGCYLSTDFSGKNSPLTLLKKKC